jgi:uncharacterized MAPEG superfamily protein
LPVELKIIAWGSVLLLIHIILAAIAATKQYGVDWNAGPRDEHMPALKPLAGRLARAQANFQETFPVAIVAMIGSALLPPPHEWTAIGGWIWLGARVVYLPLYVLGIPKIRSLAFLVSLVGLGLAIWPLLAGSFSRIKFF